MKSQGMTTLVKNRPAEPGFYSPGFFSPFLHRFYSLSILIRLALSPLKPALDSSHIFPYFAILHFCIFFRPGISPFLSAGPAPHYFLCAISIGSGGIFILDRCGYRPNHMMLFRFLRKSYTADRFCLYTIQHMSMGSIHLQV